MCGHLPTGQASRAKIIYHPSKPLNLGLSTHLTHKKQDATAKLNFSHPILCSMFRCSCQCSPHPRGVRHVQAPQPSNRATAGRRIFVFFVDVFWHGEQISYTAEVRPLLAGNSGTLRVLPAMVVFPNHASLLRVRGLATTLPFKPALLAQPTYGLLVSVPIVEITRPSALLRYRGAPKHITFVMLTNDIDPSRPLMISTNSLLHREYLIAKSTVR